MDHFIHKLICEMIPKMGFLGQKICVFMTWEDTLKLSFNLCRCTIAPAVSRGPLGLQPYRRSSQTVIRLSEGVSTVLICISPSSELE